MNRLIPATRFGRAAVVAASALAAATLAVRLIPGADAQAPLIVRMATLVPEGSSWHLVLKEALDKWKTISAVRGGVCLFPRGVAGDDPDVVRKTRLATLL